MISTGIEHWRQILRRCTESDTHANTFSDPNRDSYADGNCNSNSNAYGYTKLTTRQASPTPQTAPDARTATVTSHAILYCFGRFEVGRLTLIARAVRVNRPYQFDHSRLTRRNEFEFTRNSKSVLISVNSKGRQRRIGLQHWNVFARLASKVTVGKCALRLVSK